VQKGLQGREIREAETEPRNALFGVVSERAMRLHQDQPDMDSASIRRDRKRGRQRARLDASHMVKYFDIKIFCVKAYTDAIALLMVGAIVMVHAHFGIYMNWFGQQKGEGFEYQLLAIGLAVAVLDRGCRPSPLMASSARVWRGDNKETSMSQNDTLKTLSVGVRTTQIQTMGRLFERPTFRPPEIRRRAFHNSPITKDL
jgi:hypothetical protein